MKSIASLHQTLTSSNPNGDIKGDVYSFAKQLGWNPSYYFEPYPSMPVNGHLIVEHGLENAAIISFLKGDDDLSNSDERKLLALSYNNLLNWHITIGSRDITYYYVLNNLKYEVARERIKRDDEISILGIELFEKIIQKKPNPNSPFTYCVN